MESYYNSDMLEKFDLFKKGFHNILQMWSAFRIALDHKPELLLIYADEEKKEREIYYLIRCVLSDIDDVIVKKKHTIAATPEIGEILLFFIFDYFKVEVEDNSERLVAQDILKLHSELFREEKLVFYKELEKAAENFKGNYSVDFPITKKSVEKKIVINKEQEKNKENDNESDESDYESYYSDENENEKNEEKDSKIPELNTNKNFGVPDDDGFSEVLKTKKKKEKKEFDINENDNDLIILDNNAKNANNNSNKMDLEDDGFVEVKKKKKK